MITPTVYRNNAGFTLTELMVALTAGMLVTLAAGALLLHVKAVYADLDDAGRVQDNGRLALAHLDSMLRQANHLPWEIVAGSTLRRPQQSGLRGIDDSRAGSEPDPANGVFHATSGNGIQRSDLLMIGFFGSTPSGLGNCSGASVNAPGTETDALDEKRRQWVIYSVGNGRGNEPELRCRYQGRNGNWATEPVARGVESVQLAYGIDSDGDGRADRWLEASRIDAAQWPRVRLVRLSVLMRSDRVRTDAGSEARSYALLVPGPLTQQIGEAAGDRRLRVLFETTVWLRNPAPDTVPP